MVSFTLVLQSIGLDLVAKTDSSPLLPQIDDSPITRFLNLS